MNTFCFAFSFFRNQCLNKYGIQGFSLATFSLKTQYSVNLGDERDVYV